MNKYKITMQSGKEYIYETEYNIDEIAKYMFMSDKAWIKPTIFINVKYVESIEAVND